MLIEMWIRLSMSSIHSQVALLHFLWTTAGSHQLLAS